MKKYLFLVVFLILAAPSISLAHAGEGMSVESEEAQGLLIWEKLQNKEVSCDSLTESEYELLGEYFMGQMMGDSHDAMNVRFTRMAGEENEELMHINMGKRMSGCDLNVPLPQLSVSSPVETMDDMMGDEMSAAKQPAISEPSIMSFWNWFCGFGMGGGLFWFLAILIILVALVAFKKSSSNFVPPAEKTDDSSDKQN